MRVMPNRRPGRLCWGAAVLLACQALQANVRLPAIIGDHMVLQRDLESPIWGWADPGEKITVTIKDEKVFATAGEDGRWSVKLKKLAASREPVDITITGKNSITVHDVLVGDVWVCSGQSNMEFGIKAFMSKEELAQTAQPQIRLFCVPKCVAPSPAQDIAPAPADFPALGSWQVCTPDALQKAGEWSGFSAVGYYFGREIHDYTQQPLGLIGASWGGTRINSWISLEMLQTVPSLAGFAKAARTFRDDYDKLKQTWETVTEPQWRATLEKWKRENSEALEAYPGAVKQWEQKAKAAAAQHQPAPPRPVAPKPPRAPRDPIHDNQTTAALFNGMVAPLVPYGIKGVIWYQGESNGDEPVFYRTALPALITDWRSHWNEGDFPFLFVQLPNFMARSEEPSESGWAGTRESQAKALALPNTAMAVTIDIGDAGNIHPSDKLDVGRRLALAARHVAYAENIVYSGPSYKSSTVEGKKIRIAFDNVGGGLVIGRAPDHFYACQRPPQTPPPLASELQGFAVAGPDHKYVWAKALIDGDTVLVWNEAIPNPLTVRYAWASNPVCNLYNKEGLPACPFRTDDLSLGNH